MRVDLLVVGGGFSGSILAMAACRAGLRTMLIDRGNHPRFAIGESTTPAGNMALAAMGRHYDLPVLSNLSSYGTCRAHLGGIDVGRKRGFTYRFEQARHPSVLVAASADDQRCDTHWLRADVDDLLFREGAAAGVLAREQTQVTGLSRADAWQATLSSGERVTADVVVDATGSAAFARRYLSAGTGSPMRTVTSAAFLHVRDLPATTPAIVDPFDADAAAVHHVRPDGWMWELRFESGVSSVGIVSPGEQAPDPQAWLNAHPDLGTRLAAAAPVMPWRRHDGLQRRTACAGGPGWLLLPSAAGFVDPLHSTGIAHSLTAVERALAQLSRGKTDFTALGQATMDELDHLDHMTAACYAALDRPSAFVAGAMLYFAASIAYERDRLAEPDGLRGFLGADRRELRRMVQQAPARARQPGFEEWVRRAIEPWNDVGLMDPVHAHRYAHTAPRGW